MPESAKLDSLKILQDYAWNWFSYHAGQRMIVFRFFFVIVGVTAVGYYQNLSQSPQLAFAFSLLAVLLCILFWRLDLRSRELVEIGEHALLELEAELRALTSVKVSIVEQARSKTSIHVRTSLRGCLYSYGQIFSAVFGILLLSCLIAALHAAHRAGWTPF
jgi:uncharacterized membrane protein YraQ (UPF0718 family)